MVLTRSKTRSFIYYLMVATLPFKQFVCYMWSLYLTTRSNKKKVDLLDILTEQWLKFEYQNDIISTYCLLIYYNTKYIYSYQYHKLNAVNTRDSIITNTVSIYLWYMSPIWATQPPQKCIEITNWKGNEPNKYVIYDTFRIFNKLII